MKKLCNAKGKRVHPSPPHSSPRDFLAALPAAVLALAAALSPEEKEVLVYLLSGGNAGDRALGKKKPQQPPHQQQKNHPPELGCGCFGCYKSFWARWNASPNNRLIHRILDAVEESLEPQSPPAARRRSRRSRRRDEASSPTAAAAAVEASNPADEDGSDGGYDDEDAGEEEDGDGDVPGGECRGSVRRLVSFIGDRVWGVWNY